MPQQPTKPAEAHEEPRLKLQRGADGKLIVRCFVSYGHDDKVRKEDLLTRIKKHFRYSAKYAGDVWDDRDDAGGLVAYHASCILREIQSMSRRGKFSQPRGMRTRDET
jgi:hypothetical protein